jgi:hypothetical protein
VLFSSPASRSISLPAIEPRPMEWRPLLLTTELRLPRQKKVVADDRREDRDPTSGKPRVFGADGSSGIALKSSELKECLFGDATERRFKDFDLEEPPIEPSDINVGMVEDVECLRSKCAEMEVGDLRLSAMLEVSLRVSPISSIDGIDVSRRRGRGAGDCTGATIA